MRVKGRRGARNKGACTFQKRESSPGVALGAEELEGLRGRHPGAGQRGAGSPAWSP